MQRAAVASPEPPRHLGDLLIAIRLQHQARIAVASDRGLELPAAVAPWSSSKSSAASSCCAIV
jgi:hypothetical protein